MTITVAYRIKPESGDTSPHNEVTPAETISGGTLVDRGGGDWAWQFSGGQVSGATASTSRDSTAANNGWWLAVTIKVVTYPTVDFTPLCGFGDTTVLSTDGTFIGQNGANNLRMRTDGDKLMSGGGIMSGIGATEMTFAYRIKTNDGGTVETGGLWKKAAGAAGRAPDIVPTAEFITNPNVFDTVVFNAVNSANFQIKDFVFGFGEPTNTEMAALADDLRGTLDGSSVPTIINCTVGNANAEGLTAGITSSSGTVISCTVGNADAAGSTATIANLLTTDPIENNTESILANTAVAWSWTAAGRIGSDNGLTVTVGTGTTDVNGRLQPGFNVAPGFLKVAKLNTDAKDDDVFYQGFR